MPLSLELHLIERRADAVVVAVSLLPSGNSRIEGVALELHGEREEPVGVRVLLPIAGQLTAPIHTQAELHLPDETPPGLTIVGTAWCGDEEVVGQCPAEVCTGLDSHVRGCPCTLPERDEVDFEVLTVAEHQRLAQRFPWVGQPAVLDGDDPTADEPSEEDAIDDLCGDLGLDAESAEWLKELLSEDL